MPDIVKGETDRLLYIDGDMMCLGSLRELAEIDLKNALAGVVSDRGAKRQRKQLQVQNFFNSGVMLIHVSEWVRKNVFRTIIDMSHDGLTKVDSQGYYKGWNGLRYNDQNILNVILDGKVIWRPRKYNYIYKLNRAALFHPQDRNEDIRNR